MRKLIAIIISLLFASPGWSAELSGNWNWYHVAMSASIGGQPIFRFGTANVIQSDTKIKIKFHERAYPDELKTFVGRILQRGIIKGQIKGFFFSGHDKHFHRIRYESSRDGACTVQQITLTTGLPIGESIILSRYVGKCGFDPGPY